MDSGKTVAAVAMIRELVEMGLKGGRREGHRGRAAARHLAMKSAGAATDHDFVDVGLPSRGASRRIRDSSFAFCCRNWQPTSPTSW